ncbi:MAG: thiamine-phosphate kinase [Candidatus Electrothrix sp. AR4]|nr:thiamine-phosphate kinase [Candidatus Electrothrix sp. AR4]
MNERDLIEHIRQLASLENGDLPDTLLRGIGDDCAVIEKDDETVHLLTMDTLVESVHFDCAWHPPELLGRKAVAVNVSDIAAMGGKPVFALLSLGLPSDFNTEWSAQLSRGIIEACSQYGCLLIGGDTVCSPKKITLTLTVIGEMNRDQVLYRHTAKPGDTIWVSGPLGYSAAGLALLRTMECMELPDRYAFKMQPCVKAHLDPSARVGLASLLARTGYVHAMMDLSDGLATDLSHLCQLSRIGARIEAKRIPGHDGLSAAADFLQEDPINWMVEGGEDYELLFTASSADTPDLLKKIEEQHYTVYPVGTVVDGQGVTLVRETASGFDEKKISFQGFDHFNKS